MVLDNAPTGKEDKHCFIKELPRPDATAETCADLAHML